MESLNLSSDPPLEPSPDLTPFDYALSVAKAGTLVFPFFGAGVALFDLLTAPMRNKRMNEWCADLRLRLNDLSQKQPEPAFENQKHL